MLQDPFSLKGKLALITGGGTGLGFGIAQTFVQAGARVIITGRREEPLKDACRELGDQATYRINNIQELNTLPGLVDDIEKNEGEIDILVNNAGINMKKFANDVTDEEFNNIIQTNVNGLFALTREVSKKMVPRRRGSIINITSMAAIFGLNGVVAYGTSKTGVLGMTRILTADLSPYKIRVNAIAPGFMDTPMLRKAIENDPDRKKKILGRTPLEEFGQAEDVGYAAVYLASDAAKFVTGVNLPVDGGNSIGF